MDKDTKALLGLPAVRFAPFFAAGLGIAFYSEGMILAAALILTAAAFAVLVFLKKKAALCAFGLASGMAVMCCCTALYVRPILALDGLTAQTELYITGEISDYGDSAVYSARTAINGIPMKIRLSGSSGLMTGDTVCATVSFRLPEERYRAANLSQGIFLSGSVVGLQSVFPAKFSPERAIGRLRAHCVSLIGNNMSGDERALALSMLFGDTDSLPAGLADALKVSGAAHYTAVSGTHFTVFAAILLELLAKKHPLVKSVVSLALAPLAVVFFGASSSVIRSAVMLAICSFAPLMRRKAETLNSLCAAVAVITVVSPFTVLDAGFLMSVLGVFGAAIVGTRLSEALCQRLPARLAPLCPLLRAFMVSVCAVICTSVVSVPLFGGVSLAGAAVSLVVMPLFTAAAACAVILCVTGLGAAAVPLTLFVRAICAVVGAVGRVRGFWLVMDFHGAWVLALLGALSVTAAALAPERLFSGGMLTAALTALAAMYMSSCLAEIRSEVNFVSNGKSGAAVICVRDEAAVFICGEGSGLADDLADCFRENGVERVRCVAAPQLSYDGALTLREVCGILPVEYICANNGIYPFLADLCPDSEVSRRNADGLDISGFTIYSAKSGDAKRTGDIVMYYGYTRLPPESRAGTAVYVSGSQNVLPPNGVNIRDEDITLPISGAESIVVIER